MKRYKVTAYTHHVYHMMARSITHARAFTRHWPNVRIERCL